MQWRSLASRIAEMFMPQGGAPGARAWLCNIVSHCGVHGPQQQQQHEQQHLQCCSSWRQLGTSSATQAPAASLSTHLAAASGGKQKKPPAGAQHEETLSAGSSGHGGATTALQAAPSLSASFIPSTKPRITPLQHPGQGKRTTYIPWVYSRHMVPKRHVANRMGFLMEALEREQEMMSLARKGGSIEPFRAGDVLEVRMAVPEAEGAEYLFRGVCIARHNKGIRTAFKLLNMYPEAGPVVQHIPLHMPDLRSVKVVGRVPARKNKLYYLAKQEGGPPSYQQAPVLITAEPASGGAAGAGAGVQPARGAKGGSKGGGGKA